MTDEDRGRALAVVNREPVSLRAAWRDTRRLARDCAWSFAEFGVYLALGVALLTLFGCVSPEMYHAAMEGRPMRRAAPAVIVVESHLCGGAVPCRTVVSCDSTRRIPR